MSRPECCALSKWAETEGISLVVIPAQAGIQFFLLDSGSRPTALPGMTGCHECPALVEDFVSEQPYPFLGDTFMLRQAYPEPS